MSSTSTKWLMILGYISILVCAWLVIYLPTQNLRDEWESELNQHIKKASQLTLLTEKFGYGGFIHHFKNYVIRRDESYLDRSIALISPIEHALDELKTSATDEEKRHQIESVANTFAEYKTNALWMLHHIDDVKTMSTAELDDYVKVDDTLAFKALHRLRIESKNSLIAFKAYTSQQYTKVLDRVIACFIGITAIYWLVMIVIYQLYKQQD